MYPNLWGLQRIWTNSLQIDSYKSLKSRQPMAKDCNRSIHLQKQGVSCDCLLEIQLLGNRPLYDNCLQLSSRSWNLTWPDRTYLSSWSQTMALSLWRIQKIHWKLGHRAHNNPSPPQRSQWHVRSSCEGCEADATQNDQVRWRSVLGLAKHQKCAYTRRRRQPSTKTLGMKNQKPTTNHRVPTWAQKPS